MGQVEVLDVILREVLHLDEAPGPAAGPGSVELHESAGPVVCSGHLEHGLVFLVGGLSHLGPDLEDSLDAGVIRGGLDVGDVLLVEGVEADAEGLGQPALELRDGVGIAEACELHGLLVEPGLNDGVGSDGVADQGHVEEYAAVIDLLVDGIELLLLLGHLVPGGRLVYLALDVDVPDAVGLEGRPFVREILRVVAGVFLSEQARLGIGLGYAEQLDEVLALGHLLLLEAKRSAGLGQAEREAAAGALDHRAVPLNGVEPLVLLEGSGASEVVGEADPLEGCVVCAFAVVGVAERLNEPPGQMLSLSHVHYLGGLVVYGVGHQEDPELRICCVFVQPGVYDGGGAVGLDVYV